MTISDTCFDTMFAVFVCFEYPRIIRSVVASLELPVRVPNAQPTHWMLDWMLDLCWK